MRHDLDERFCRLCRMPLVYAGSREVEPARDEAHEWARKIRPEYAEGPLVAVAGARHQAEAELIQGLLLQEGVPSVVRRSAGFDVPDFLAAGPRDVLVPEAGAEAARELLEGTAPAPPEGGAPPDLRRAARLAAVVLAGAALAALVAWLLLGAAH